MTIFSFPLVSLKPIQVGHILISFLWNLKCFNFNTVFQIFPVGICLIVFNMQYFIQTIPARGPKIIILNFI